MDTQKIRNDDHCFCCGVKNDRGLKLTFAYPEEGRAETGLVVPDYSTGWADITHGGFISMFLDEVMAHACISSGLTGFTAELTVRFIKPLPVGTEILVEGKMEEQKKRIALTKGTVKDLKGTLYAEGKAKFVRTN